MRTIWREASVDIGMRSDRIVVRMTCMAQARPRYSKEEFARRGDEIYTRDIQAVLPTNARGQFVAIDIETGAYEIDVDELTASDRLLARYPEAQIWLRRVGSRYVRRFRHHQCSDRLSHVTSG